MEKLPGRLRQLRLEKGFSQKHVADSTGVVHAIISEYELGQKTPSLASFFRLCRFFDVSADYLLGLSDNRKRDA